MLAVDLGAFQQKSGDLTAREIWARLAAWVTLAAAFGAGIWYVIGQRPALEFAAGYLLEESLSVDNIFVIILLFRAFKVPKEHEHRVLFWGIIGAAILRALLILAGTAAMNHFAWLNFVFGGFLVITGVKIFFDHDNDDAPDSFIVRSLKRVLKTTPELRGKHFFVREAGRWVATPLFLTLLIVEFTDVVFALDSIPAVFGVTTDPFIVFTSNIFAIVGLRTLFFLVSSLVDAFRFLPYGVAIVLTFIGAKMCAARWVHVPVGLSLLIVGGVLCGAIVLSLIVRKKATQ